MTTSPEELIEIIRSGRKIEAIKRLREADGIGLKEAKEQVEQLERELAASDPNYKPSSGGCAALFFLAALLPWLLLSL